MPARPGRPAPARIDSVRGAGAIALPKMRQLVLGPELFLFQFVEGGVVHRQHAQFRIAYLAVELLVALIKAAEFRIALHQHFDFLLLVLEHQPTSSRIDNEPARRRADGDASRTWIGIGGTTRQPCRARLHAARRNRRDAGAGCGQWDHGIAMPGSRALRPTRDGSTLLLCGAPCNRNFLLAQTIVRPRIFRPARAPNQRGRSSRITSTRRFLARPSSVSLPATG